MARILVIDDDYEIRLALRKLLELSGYEVIEAANGHDGARLYSRNPVDLIITDIFMPDKDGVEVLLELRTDYPDIKVIVISGEGRNFLPAAQDFGALRTFPKPFPSQELLQAVKELLET
ncbi:MAG: response regulator [bacterium]|nr:response regulator [bacterium]